MTEIEGASGSCRVSGCSTYDVEVAAYGNILDLNYGSGLGCGDGQGDCQGFGRGDGFGNV